jgi:Mg-chelatase subunit ChlI
MSVTLERGGQVVLDYRGNECDIEPLYWVAATSPDMMQSFRDSDPRRLAQEFAAQLNDLQERIEHAQNALAQARANVSLLDDSAELESALVVLGEFVTLTSNRMFEARGRALAVLEYAGMVELSRKREGRAA